MEYYVGIDLGGTNIAAAIVTGEGQILRSDSLPTKAGRTAAEIVEDMAKLVQQLLDSCHIRREALASIGVGVPGTANQETGCIEFANNLGFYDEPLTALLEDAFPGVPIAFDNDANAAAWGEYLFGAGRGCHSMIAVTLGTGVGGGIILDGRLYEGINYAAGELGHFVIQCDGIPCNCGRRGCFEQYASATALVRQTREAMKKHSDSLLWKLSGGSLEAVEGRTLFDAVRKQDETAVRVLEQFTRYLAVGIVNLINTFQPEVICIGGGISKAADLYLAPIRETAARESYTRTSAHQTRIEQAVLGNDAGLIGAALLARLKQ